VQQQALIEDVPQKIDITRTFEEYVDSFELHARDCINIKDHNTAKIVPLIFNRGQRILHVVAEKQKASMGFIRILFLKSRRFGGSTYVEGRFYWLTSLNFFRSAFIVGHEKESTNTLFEMAKLMQETNPIAPQEIKNNEKSLKFDTKDGKGLKSEYRLGTAENVDAGRSQGIHYLHGSEEAFWRDGGTLLEGLISCVPDPPAESEIFRESTANGYGNSFQEDVTETYAEGKYPYYEQDGVVYAWHNPNDSDWVVVFIPWFVHELNSKEFEHSIKREEFEKRLNEKVFDKEVNKWIDCTALVLKKRFNLSLEQLHWREWAIKNKCRGSERIFCQEYPATVEEAFLSKGSNIFGREHCDLIESQCKPPIITGDIIDRMGVSRIRANQYGRFKVWEKPDKNEIYFLTVDSAGGQKRNIDKKNKKAPDKTVVDVWNHRTGVQAAQWQGDVEYDLISDLTVLIGKMYFNAPACVELQNHGYTVVAGLKKAKYKMFEWKPGEPGWSTNRKTKPVMIDTLYQLSRDSGIQIRCKETVSEMRTFIEENSHLEAATGCKDDRVMSAAMASQMMTMLPGRLLGSTEQGGIQNWNNKNQQKSSQYQEVYAE
jgi:hypothetical protein